MRGHDILERNRAAEKRNDKEQEQRSAKRRRRRVVPARGRSQAAQLKADNQITCTHRINYQSGRDCATPTEGAIRVGKGCYTLTLVSAGRGGEGDRGWTEADCVRDLVVVVVVVAIISLACRVTPQQLSSLRVWACVNVSSRPTIPIDACRHEGESLA